MFFFFLILYLMVTYLFYSGLLPPTTFLMICQHFLPLLNQIFVTNSIIISARIPSMLPMQSLGDTRNALSIRASIAWPSIISLFLVGYLIFFSQIIKLIYNISTSYFRGGRARVQPRPTPLISHTQPAFSSKHTGPDVFRCLEQTWVHHRLRYQGSGGDFT